MTLKIAVDGMGGDYAPQVVVEGAVEAANDFDYEIVLVGQEKVLKRELKSHKVSGGKLFIHHASEVVGMGESPVQAIKKKKDSSINVCIDLLNKREVQAVVTAGNTGAAVATSTLNLGLLPGIRRPGIIISIPTTRGVSLLMDVGANIDPDPEHLKQYAIMSDIYSRYVYKKRRPNVALLNIGEEESKGTERMKETYRLLRESAINFIGNIEGRDVFTGKADCVICDGFVGNIMLKMAESLLETVIGLVRKEFSKNYIFRLGALLCKPALSAIQNDTNYEEAGGAQLLGVNGTVIISHGASSSLAIRNAIRKAGLVEEMNINETVVKELSVDEKKNVNSFNPKKKESQNPFPFEQIEESL